MKYISSSCWSDVSFVPGAPPCKQAYVMQRPVQNARGDGREDFWDEDDRVVAVSLCVPVPMEEPPRRVIYFCRHPA